MEREMVTRARLTHIYLVAVPFLLVWTLGRRTPSTDDPYWIPVYVPFRVTSVLGRRWVSNPFPGWPCPFLC